MRSRTKIYWFLGSNDKTSKLDNYINQRELTLPKLALLGEIPLETQPTSAKETLST